MPDFETAFRAAIREHLTTNRDKIRTCWAGLSEAQIWQRPNDNTLAPANQLVHLSGNLRQWVLSGLAGVPDTRARDAEFAVRGGLAKAELLDRFEQILDAVLALLDAPIDPTRRLTIQGFDTTPVGVWVHVTEHLSYHTGQLLFFAKALLDAPYDFYGDKQLDALN